MDRRLRAGNRPATRQNNHAVWTSDVRLVSAGLRWMFAASTWPAAGQPPPARPGQAGRWAAGRGRPATVVSVISDGDRLACAGRTYALPSARWEPLLTCRPGNNAPCRSVLSQRDTEPGIAEILAKDAPDHAGHGAPHGLPARHRQDCPRPARSSLEVFRLDGRAARIRSADCELCPHCCGHVVSTEYGRPPGPTGWRRRRHSGFDEAFSRRRPGGRLRSCAGA